MYVDDTLMYARNKDDILEVVRRLREDRNMTLEAEDKVAGFLSVHIKWQDSSVCTSSKMKTLAKWCSLNEVSLIRSSLLWDVTIFLV